MVGSSANVAWRMRLTKEQREDLDAVRKDFQAGKLFYPASILARAIVKELGIEVREKTVATWLTAKD